MTDADKLPQNESLQEESPKVREIAAFVAGGGAVGALTSTTVGGMGLAVAGTAVSVGLLPVAALGMVIGLAAYGVKRALFDDVTSTTSPEAKDQDDGTQTHIHTEDSASSDTSGMSAAE